MNCPRDASDWRWASVAWRAPLYGSEFFLVAMIGIIGWAHLTWGWENLVVNIQNFILAIWLGSVLAGAWFTALCFCYFKKYKNAFKNAISGLLVLVFLGGVTWIQLQPTGIRGELKAVSDDRGQGNTQTLQRQ